MVSARLAIGSVAVLALGALAIGSAPYWLHKGAPAGTATPWGGISSLDVNRAEAAQPDERAKLLELATLKSALPPEAPAPAAAIAPADANAIVETRPSAAPMPDAAPSVAAADAQPAVAPQQMASVEAPAIAPTAPVESADRPDASDRLNINTASVNALDHLPGAGRIGHTIVSHRPYKSVKDLVSRRILRTSDFQKIQARISVD